MTPKQLADIILKMPAHEPRALEVLRNARMQTDEMYPDIPQVERAKVFYEMRDIREASTNMVEAIANIAPIPVQSGHQALEGFAL